MKIDSISNWEDEKRVDFCAGGEVIARGFGESTAERFIDAMSALRVAGAMDGEAFAPIHEEWRGLTLEEVLRRAAAAHLDAIDVDSDRVPVD